MQSLWSRASQATSRCGCRACNMVAHSAGRRVTPPRRKPTFAELFTAAYTSVFASAAVLDSGFKEKRRRELDEKLEGAKRDLATLRQRNEEREKLAIEADLEWITDHQMDVLYKTLKLMRPWKGTNTLDSLILRHSDLRKQLQHSHYNCAGTSIRTLYDHTEQDRIDQAILYEDANSPADQRNPTTDQHVHELGRDVRTLVRRLVREANKLAENRSTESSPSLDAVVKLLTQESHPWYQNAQTDPETARNAILDLNRACRSAALKSELGVQEQVGRVCYNLMVSRYPPDITTFNTLISSFSRAQQLKGFTRAITWANFQWFKYRPSRSTFASTMRSQRVLDEFDTWMWLVKCIVGEDAYTGAKYKRLRVSRGHRVRATGNITARTRNGDFIYDHAPLNPMMVEQILHGLLWFGRLGSCMTFLISCTVARVPVTERMVTGILNECVAALDWKSAIDLVQHMARYGQLWWGLIVGKSSSSIAYLIDRMYSILDMIGLGDSADFASEQKLELLGLSKEGLATLFESLDQTNQALRPKERIRRQRGAADLDDAARASRSRMLQMECMDKELNRATLRARRLDNLMFDINIPISAPLLIHASNIALAKGQTLGSDIADILSVLRDTTASERDQVNEEVLEEGPRLHWAEMSPPETLSLNRGRFGRWLDWRLDSARPMYRETVDPVAVSFWITAGRERTAEAADEKRLPQMEKRVRATQATPKRALSQEETKAQTKSRLLALDQLEVQMQTQRRAAYS